MATIVTRAGKGSPLTNTEVDANFTNLNTDKAELSGANFTGSIDVTGSVVADGLTVSGDSTIGGSSATSNVLLDLVEPTSSSDIILGVSANGSGRTQIRSTQGLGTSSDLRLLTVDGTQTKERLKIAANGDISFYEDTGSTPKFIWSAASESLGIGRSPLSLSSYTVLDLGAKTVGSMTRLFGASGMSHQIMNNNTDMIISADDNDQKANTKMRLRTDGTDRVVVDDTGIDVSGSVSAGTVAQVYTSSDRGYFVAGTNDSSNQHLYLGSYHGSTLKQLTFSGSNNALYPQTTASIDLGLTTHKFKNLFLSGSVTSTGLTVEKIGDATAPTVALTTTSSNTFNHAINAFAPNLTTGEINLIAVGKEGSTKNSGYMGFKYNGDGSDSNLLTFGHWAADNLLTISASGNTNIPNGKLGIGFTTAPDTKLHVVGGTANGTMYDTAVFAGGANSTSGSGARIYISGCENDPLARGTIIEGKMIDNGNSHELNFYTSGNSQVPAKRLTIDSSGNTTFKTSAGHLTVKALGGGSVELESNGSLGYDIAANFSHEFRVAGTERMRISNDGSCRWTPDGTTHDMTLTASGNLLVGTTSVATAQSPTQTGVSIRGPIGRIEASADGTTSAIFNRETNSGAIVNFASGGTTAGSIGTVGGDVAIYSTGSSHAGLRFAINAYLPTNNAGAVVDATTDFGTGAYRYKDLYLSGGVVFGPASASNVSSQTLSSYEQGTFTPTLTGSTGNPTVSYVNQIGKYTKVGNLVTVFISVRTSDFTGGSGDLQIDGLPFATDGDAQGGSISFYRVNSFSEVAPHISASTSRVVFLGRDTTGLSNTWAVMQTNSWGAANPTLAQFSVTYFTNS